MDQLQPGKLGGARAAGAAPTGTPQADSQDAARDIAVAYNITAIGSYEAVARFVHGLRTGLGTSVVRSVRLVSTSETNARTVRAVVETEHYAFDAAPGPGPEGATRAANAEER